MAKAPYNGSDPMEYIKNPTVVEFRISNKQKAPESCRKVCQIYLFGVLRVLSHRNLKNYRYICDV